MGGVEGSLDDGLTKFKDNFNPTINEMIGEFDIPVYPFMYRLIHVHKEDKILDAACGSGGFLIKAMSKMIKIS